MSALGSDGLQNSVEEILRSQTNQPAVRSVLPPFSEILSVDGELKLSNVKFKVEIDDFFKHKNTTPLSQLRATPPFPTPHLLAQCAYKAYEVYNTGETDAQYETWLALPEGWKLLTTASNSSANNGYFGAAYWHPEHQQVVIAHRGTDLKNVGAVWTDIKGVLLNRVLPQMKSASTFAHKVVEVLREISRITGVSFHLFFTGHSLGGWLAQITTFTTEYLKIEGDLFLRSYNYNDCYHPHTVVFDSPGCKDMLLQMTDKLDVRHDGRSIDLQHLDITSYLSAPNRINTCNIHLGTIYRIFTDLSDLGWWEKHTELYTLSTHSMHKIVEAFDPVTGQIRKDKQGKIKVHVVVDWPVSDGFSGGEEYKMFFKWAEHLNNYHPDIEAVSYKHFCPIRYQTKLYDERVNSLSVFSHEEQEFLENCRRLRQWPKFRRLKNLFFVINNSQAQEKTENVLQNFEIENVKIHCKDASVLQDLIPYVKRLLQLFPAIKDIRNSVYQCETKCCIEQIKQSPLEVNSNALNVREFLENRQQQVLLLQMVDVDEWTGLIKLHQVLQKNNCLIEGHYTLLKLERFLTLNMLMDFRTLMQSLTAPHLILLTCETSQLQKKETKDTIRIFFEAMKQKPLIKLILTSPSEDKSVPFLQDTIREIFGNGFVTRDEQLTWPDLTSISQQKLLEKSVKFQDTKVSLNKLMSTECPVAEFLPLGNLLAGRELKIADPAPVSNGYNESYYIGRTLLHQKVIKQGIFNSKEVKEKHVFLASTEEKFKQLCQLYPKSNVHWLEKDKLGNLLWQQSQGSLETVRRYIDTDSSQTYTDRDLDKLLEQAQYQRVMMISDTAGMGKSTVLTHLCKIIKRTFQAKWVVRIDLNNHVDVLKGLKQGQIDSKKAIEFVSERMLKLKPGLEMELFKYCCEQKQKLRIVLMLDGFDEISPLYKQTVIHLLQALRQTAVEQLWITTRPHLKEELEDQLHQLSYTLEPFSEEDQVEFLKKFWSLKDWFTEPEGKEVDIEKNKLEIYAEHLIKRLANSISDKDREFTGIPLQTRMLAEAFDQEVKIFYTSTESMPDLPFKLDLFELYRLFIERKYDIYQEEKCQINVNNVIAMEQRECDLKTMSQELQLLAMKVLFTEEQVALFPNNNQSTSSVEKLTRFGILHVSHDDKPHFIHRTFAEYYVAHCLVSCLTEGNNTSENVKDFILTRIFLEEQYQVIRAFIDGLLSRTKPSEEKLKQYGTRIDELRNNSLLHRAAMEGKENIIKFLLESVRAGGYRDKVIGLLLGQDTEGKTAWYMAAGSGELNVLQLIWLWAKQNLTTEEIKNKLLLATDSKGNAAWHWAAFCGKQDVLQKIWDLAKDNLTTEEMKNKLLLAKHSKGNTAWHLAAGYGKQDVLQKIWDLAKHILTTEEIKNNLLFETDRGGNNAWFLTVEYGTQNELQKIFDWAKEILTTDEIKNKLLLAKDSHGNTTWKLAAYLGKQDALQKIWDLAKDYLTTEEIKMNCY